MKWRASIYLSVFVLGLVSTSMLFAQKDGIKSGAYRVMLKGLLSHTVPEMSVEDAALATQPTLFIDTRERSEFEVSHIQGARWVGFDDFDINRVADVAKDTPLIVYCSVGYRSEKVAEKLIKMGYQNVSNLYGGIFEWKNQGYDVWNKAGEKTEQVHAFDKTWGVWLKGGEKVY